jgi:hypothetical protein
LASFRQSYLVALPALLVLDLAPWAAGLGQSILLAVTLG